jgi:hypothetical protein
MAAALAHAHPPEQVEPARAHLSLVKPAVDRRALRAAWIINTFASDYLSLDARDARQLEKLYGWQPEASLMLGVRSVPGHVVKLVLLSELKQLVGDCDEWPAGFWMEGDALRFECETRYGLILQVWRRWPVGLMYYRHPGDKHPRWVSSATRETGTAAVASVHCQAMKEDHAEVSRVFMVSHTLEAMAVAIKQGVSCVAYNGTAVASVPAQLFEGFPKLRGVVLAMPDAPPRLERELRDAGLSVTTWGGGELI